MSEYMMLEGKTLTKAEIDAAINRAHRMRSEAAWSLFVKLGDWVHKITHSNAPSDSELAHSS